MLECPFCKQKFNIKSWGIHTIECDKNPKNIKKDEIIKPKRIKKIVKK